MAGDVARHEPPDGGCFGPSARLGARVSDVRRIGVLRASGIGDYVFALPALESLRAAYPDAELVLMGAPWHEREIAGRPGPVDRVVVAPPMEGIREPVPSEEDCSGEAFARRIAEFLARMRWDRLDLAIQMHGGGRNSNPLVNAMEARVTVGSRTPDAQALDRWIPFEFYHHEVLRCLEIAGLAGAPPVTLMPRWEVDEHDRAIVRELALGESLAFVAPGAGDPRRRWTAEGFAAVGDSLAAAGARVVLIGADFDAPLVEEVRGRMRGTSVDLAGKLSLRGLAALLESGRVLVGNDSGLLHLARAVSCRTVGVYWCGNLINAGPLTLAGHRAVLSWRLDCPACGADCTRADCGHQQTFVGDVCESEVTAAALALWEEGAQTPVTTAPVAG